MIFYIPNSNANNNCTHRTISIIEEIKNICSNIKHSRFV